MDKFKGFNQNTIEYFWGAYLDNSKSYYEKNKQKYIDNVRDPLRLLHQALMPTIQGIDPSICVVPGRCISRAFNDFRYSGKVYPIKDYMYLHFCASVANEEADTPGMFFSANYREWSCGFFVYRATNARMVAFRKAVLKNKDEFSVIVRKINANPRIQLKGEEYKRDHYLDMPDDVKQYLNRKRFYLSAEYPLDYRFDSSALADEIAGIWELLAPMYQFYLQSLRDDNPK